jgi:hypothetical protein
MTVTLRKKLVVSAFVTSRGSNSKGYIGQIRENTSVIFTNFVGLSFPIGIISLTVSAGHDPFFDPSPRGLMEAVGIAFPKAQVPECLTFPSYRFFQNLKLVAVDELHYYTGLFGRLVNPTARR